jgi:predicted P-loop ATPase
MTYTTDKQAQDIAQYTHWAYTQAHYHPGDVSKSQMIGDMPDIGRDTLATLRTSKVLYAQAFVEFAKRLGYRWDTRTQGLYSKADRTHWTGLLLEFAKATGIDYPDLAYIKPIIETELEPIDPVRADLGLLAQQHPESWGGWDSLARDLFGTEDPLHQLMLSKWLIGAVARAYAPGCKMDNALVLQGSQGIGKTTFFEVLGGAYFATIHQHTKDSDRTRLIARRWILELGELEGISRKHDIEAMKALLSATTDDHRALYTEQVEAIARRCVFGGTANSTEILTDPTGSRRFWVLPCAQVDINYLKDNRGRILAEAVRRYHEGEQWWLGSVEAAAISRANEVFHVVSEWAEPIRTLTETVAFEAFETLIPARDLYMALRVDRPKAASREISGLLRQQGWGAEKRRIDGRSRDVWVYNKGAGDPEVLQGHPLAQACFPDIKPRAAIGGGTP